MKRFVACFAVAACVAPSAMAAMVDLGGPYEVIVGSGEIIQIPFTVVSSDGGAFTTFDMAIGSDTVAMVPDSDGVMPPDTFYDPTDGDWAYSPVVISSVLQSVYPIGIPTAFELGVIPEPIYPYYREGLFKIGANFLLGHPSPPFLLGTLTIDTTGLALGEHYLYVGDQVESGGPGDPEGRDGGYSTIAFTDGHFERLRGTGVISVVPEPTTVLLLAVGGLAVWCRRSRTRPSVYNGPTEPIG